MLLTFYAFYYAIRVDNAGGPFLVALCTYWAADQLWVVCIDETWVKQSGEARFG